MLRLQIGVGSNWRVRASNPGASFRPQEEAVPCSTTNIYKCSVPGSDCLPGNSSFQAFRSLNVSEKVLKQKFYKSHDLPAALEFFKALVGFSDKNATSRPATKSLAQNAGLRSWFYPQLVVSSLVGSPTPPALLSHMSGEDQDPRPAPILQDCQGLV